MTTLREIWEQKRMSPTEVAALARISVTTLYKMNKKSPDDPVSEKTIKNVCQVLDISPDAYEQLEAAK